MSDCDLLLELQEIWKKLTAAQDHQFADGGKQREAGANDKYGFFFDAKWAS